MFKFLSLSLVTIAVASTWAAPSNKITSGLASSLAQNGEANVFVTMKSGTIDTLNSLNQRIWKSRSERINTVVSSLKAHAASSQKPVLDVLSKQRLATFESFWITNQVYIKHAGLELIEKIAALEEVSKIDEELMVSLIDPIIPKNPKNEINAEWGVDRIEAQACWASGLNGTGAVVGFIDTGVRSTHIDLASNYYGTYGWFDTVTNSVSPFDDHGHGTHVAGTACGLNGIGVAPGAKWMACKGLSATGAGAQAGLIRCGQFLNCPSLPDGSDEQCDRAPDVVSNSWGGGQGNLFFDGVINSWRSSGIIPVFANGNSGPACRTANSPGDSTQVIAVGATTSNDELADYSSKGPNIGGNLMKPDISAPGSMIRSAWATNDSSYQTISGTSMATPHVAGVAALLMGYNPGLFYFQVRNYLINNTDRNVTQTGYNCGNLDESNFPNYAFGYGIVNARASCEAVRGSK